MVAEEEVAEDYAEAVVVGVVVHAEAADAVVAVVEGAAAMTQVKKEMDHQQQLWQQQTMRATRTSSLPCHAVAAAADVSVPALLRDGASVAYRRPNPANGANNTSERTTGKKRQQQLESITAVAVVGQVEAVAAVEAEDPVLVLKAGEADGDIPRMIP